MLQEDKLAKEEKTARKLINIKKKRMCLAEFKKTMIEKEKRQITITDPESRSMKINKNRDVAYNLP